jgi:hypothetical protein
MRYVACYEGRPVDISFAGFRFGDGQQELLLIPFAETLEGLCLNRRLLLATQKSSRLQTNRYMQKRKEVKRKVTTTVLLQPMTVDEDAGRGLRMNNPRFPI